MDDYFPCIEDSPNHFEPAFCKTSERELWVMLLEKAYAKVHGAYFKINSGLTGI